MGNGSGDSDIGNDCNLCVDRLDKTIGTGIKSNVRCCDVSDEWVGRYDASFLTRFQPSNSTRKNISIRYFCILLFTGGTFTAVINEGL